MTESDAKPVAYPNLPYCEAELLDELTPHTAHADELALLTGFDIDPC